MLLSFYIFIIHCAHIMQFMLNVVVRKAKKGDKDGYHFIIFTLVRGIGFHANRCFRMDSFFSYHVAKNLEDYSFYQNVYGPMLNVATESHNHILSIRNIKKTGQFYC